MNNEITNITMKFKKLHILVIGDLMLDVYQSGRVKRISPEAPVPIVEIKNSFERLGGAGNVCLNITSLNAKCSSIGIIGKDPTGEKIKSLMSENNINYEHIIINSNRPTTTKTRIIANDQQVVRIDNENISPIDNSEENEILHNVKKTINKIDAIILQDYNKGLLTEKLIHELIKLANENSKPIFVDPKFDNFFSYKNVFLFKPNKKETEKILGFKFDGIDSIKKGAEIIKEKLQCKNVLITLGEEGMLLLTNDGEFYTIPTQAKQVHDVSGAGDTVISAMAVFYSAEYSLKESTIMANVSAGKVCESFGVVPIKFDDLQDEINRYF
ncbi:MAG: D-glycero-beta-D-manno-heptose-7-phosphate kinase [Candidatus Marinimicrobia bacterium]|nr:D-glycero-beta-D-manno-heptose-7-phosphate kinase [Candidatus Neomarinimicrobiota bacterium]